MQKFFYALIIGLLWQTSEAQTPLNLDGAIHRIEFNAGFQDFVIPDDPTITQVLLLAKGGDGGIARVERESCTSPGGVGATLALTLDIGDEPGQIPRGARLRFIPGGKGADGITRSDVLGTGFAYGGGGGGSGILFETPDTAAWQILAVAGGGGGAYVGRAVGFCVNNGSAAEGQGGREGIAGGDGKGGFFGGKGGTTGGGGRRSEFAGGGGGYRGDGDGVTCITIEFPPTTYQAGAGRQGYPEGGRGGLDDDCIDVLRINTGGFGFGGGGAGWGAGGGGGGYSGGGAGATTGGGGGGGSFLHPIAGNGTIAAGGATRNPTDGYIEYQVIRKQEDAPVAQCQPIRITLDESGLAILDPAQLDNGSADAGGGTITFTVNKDTFDCSDLGEQIITLTVTGETGLASQCTAKVTISDTEAPVLNCPTPEDVIIDNAPGACGATFDYSEWISFDDNCDVTLSYSHLPGAFFNIGETEVTVTAGDAAGNEASCSFSIRVIDAEAPQMVCPSDIRISCGERPEPEITGLPSMEDNCDAAPVLSYADLVSGDCRIECVIERTWTVTDANDNTGTCVQTITQGSREIIEEALSKDLDLDGNSDPIVLGYSNRTLTIGEDALECIIGWLPHTGGRGAPLPRGQHTVDPADCLPGASPLSEDGRLQNRLLAELLLLSIKLRQNPELGDIPVRDLDCQFSVMVQQTLRPYSTVNSILRLGNITLANLYGPFYEPIGSAIQCINHQFPLCSSPESAASKVLEEMDLRKENRFAADHFRLYPNPAAGEIFFEAPGLTGQTAVLRIYNLQGQLATEQRIQEWPAAPLRLTLDSRWRGAYILNLLVEGKTVQTRRFVVE